MCRNFAWEAFELDQKIGRDRIPCDEKGMPMYSREYHNWMKQMEEASNSRNFCECQCKKCH